LSELAKKNPIHVAVRLNLALCHAHDGNSQLAKNLIEHVLSDEPENFLANIYTGIFYLKLGSYELAVNQFIKMLQINPFHIDIRLNLALAYKQMGDTENLITLLTEILDSVPGNLPAKVLIGIAYGEAGDYRNAIRNLAEVAFSEKYFMNKSLPKGDTFWIKSLHETIHYNLGVAYLNKGNLENAKRSFDEVLTINPQNSDVRRTMNSLELNFKNSCSKNCKK
jgi:tetratricopeptide (TPR) repeat protein